LFFAQLVCGKRFAAPVNEKQIALAVMPLEVSAQPCLKLLGHGQIRTARLGLHGARYPRSSINALPDAINVLCEVHIPNAKGERFTDAQAKYACDRNDCAQWLRSVADDLPHLIIRE